MTTKEVDNLAQRIGEFYHLFKDYTLFEFDNTEKDVLERIEQLKHDLTDIGAIDEIIFVITDCSRNLDDSYNNEACDLIKLLKEQRTFLERNRDIRMVGETGYEVKHAIHVGDKEIVFAEDKDAENGLCYFVGNYTSNEILGQYADCQVSDDFLESIQEFTGRVSGQIEAVRAARNEITVPMDAITAGQCYPNDLSESIDGKVVAVRADALRREYQTADRQLVLVTGGFGANANSRGSAVFCTNLYHGKHTRWERRDIQGEVKPEFLPEWAKEKAAAIQAEKGTAQPNKEKKDKGDAR